MMGWSYEEPRRWNGVDFWVVGFDLVLWTRSFPFLSSTFLFAGHVL